MYWINLYKDWKRWKKIKKIANENVKILSKNGFRIDWIGRIYTVINLPLEMSGQPDFIKDSYVLQELQKYNKLFFSIGIADGIFPEFRQIGSENSYLLILSPMLDYLNRWKVLKNFILWIVGLFITIFLFLNVV